VYFDDRLDRSEASLADAARMLASSHLARAPRTNPCSRMKKRIQADVEWLAQCDLATFHRYAFGTCRQCGANAELAAAFVEWLQRHGDDGLSDVVDNLRAVATGCKSLQFALARVARGRSVDVEELFGTIEDSWDAAVHELRCRYA
jgi:hypothetical protein